MSEEYPTGCACGSRCDGHAVAATEDPRTEWCGFETAPHRHMGHALLGGPEPMTLQDPITRHVYRIVEAATTEGEIIEETRYSDRSPREEWVSAWEVSRMAHR